MREGGRREGRREGGRESLLVSGHGNTYDQKRVGEIGLILANFNNNTECLVAQLRIMCIASTCVS